MSNQLLIYALLDPETKEVRYIGKSSNGLKRPKEHWLPCRLKTETNTYKLRWMQKILSKGLTPKVEILRICSSQDELNKSEIEFISAYRDTSRLTNLCDGGIGTTGHKVSVEARLKISKALTGRFPGDKNPFWGKDHTDESKAKIIAANIGKKPTDATNKKRGKSISNACRNKSPLMRGVDITGHVIEFLLIDCEHHGFHKTKIVACAKGRAKRKTHKGFRWSYV